MKTIAFLPRVIGAAWPKPLLLKRPWARQAASTIGGDDPDGGSPDPNSPLDDCYAAVRSGSTGLMSAEARIRLRINGFNEVSHEKAPHWLRQLVSAFNNPFIWVLFALATISYLSDPNDLKPVIIVSVMVGLSVVLRFWQEFRSSRTAEALKAMVSNTATVARRDHPASPPPSVRGSNAGSRRW